MAATGNGGAEGSIRAFRPPSAFKDGKEGSEGHGSLLSDKDRIALIHKGNALFTAGRFDLAERVFRTARYQDGLRRVAQRRLDEGSTWAALDLFRLGRSLAGEYACWKKLGLLPPALAVVDEESRRQADDQLNRKLAALVRKMMATDG